MNTFLTSALRTGTIVLLSGSLVACGPEDMQSGGLSNMAYADGEGGLWGPETLAQLGGGYGPGLDALPMSTAYEGDYDYAPSWDYRDDGYAYYDDGGAQYDRFDYYDDGYAPYDSYAPIGYADSGSYLSSPGSDQFALLALAAMVAMVIGNSPPDYGFAYTDSRPWAWRMHDGYMRYAEPVRGGYRYYYYEPNTARPFLVRDPYYSYGYRGDRVVVVYDRYGHVVDRRARLRLTRAASSYYSRGGDLYRAGRDRTHYGVSARHWESRRAALSADRRALRTAREKRRAWQRWDDRNENRLAKQWASERHARVQAAKRYDDWQEASYRGPAPKFYEAKREKSDHRQVAIASPQRDNRARRIAKRRTEQRDDARQLVRAQRLQKRSASAERNQRFATQEARKAQQSAQRQRLAAKKVAERRKASTVQQRQRAEVTHAKQQRRQKVAAQQAQQAKARQVQARQAQRERVAASRQAAERQKQQQAKRQQAQRQQAQRQQAQRQKAQQARARVDRQKQVNRQASNRQINKRQNNSAKSERGNKAKRFANRD